MILGATVDHYDEADCPTEDRPLPPAATLEAQAPAIAPHPRQYFLAPEDYPDTAHIVTEDDTPVENFFIERLLTLLTEPLRSSWTAPNGVPFIVSANVGLFYQLKAPALVPDVMLSLDVQSDSPPDEPEKRSYFLWEMGKPPDVVVELVSDQRGGEDTDKLTAYARIGVPYYIIYDRFDLLGGGELRAFALREGVYHPISPSWLPGAGLGMTMWTGPYAGWTKAWPRWCDRNGVVIPSGIERAEAERLSAAAERQRAEAERQITETERQRAEAERQRADQTAERVRLLEERLRALGQEPPE